MRFSFEIVKGESFLINLSSEVLIGNRGKFDCRLRAKGEFEGFGSMRAWPEEEGGSHWLGEGLIQFTLVLIIRRFEFGQGSGAGGSGRGELQRQEMRSAWETAGDFSRSMAAREAGIWRGRRVEPKKKGRIGSLLRKKPLRSCGQANYDETTQGCQPMAG